MNIFLCHLLIYCFPATNVSFFALFHDTRAAFYRLCFTFASWLSTDGTGKTLQIWKRKTFSSSRVLFFYMVASGSVCRGPGSVPSTKDVSWVQKQALSNTCQHTLSTGRGLNPSLTGASSSEFLSFFINHLSFSFRDSYYSLQLLL